MNIPQYITQLTRQWIRDVSKRLTAGNCILVKEDENNRVVEVDIDALKLQIGEIDDEGFVKTTGNQSITGVKTFKGVEPIKLDSNGGTFSRFKFINGNSTLGYVGSYDHVSTGMFASKATVIWGGGANGEAQCLLVGQHDDYGVGVYMNVAPTDSDSTSLNKVPTMGWVNDKFSRKTHTHSGYAASDHIHSGYASSSHNHDSSYAAIDHDHDSSYSAIDHTHGTEDIEGLSDEISSAITAWSNQEGIGELKTNVATILDDYVTTENLDDFGDNVVKLTGDQTVGGVKTFSSRVRISSPAGISQSSNNSYLLLCGSNEYDTGGHIVLGSNLAETNGGGIVDLRTNLDGKYSTLTLRPGNNQNLTYSENGAVKVKMHDGIDCYSTNPSTGRSWWTYNGFRTSDNIVTGYVISGIDGEGNHDAYLRAIKNGVISSIRVNTNGTSGQCSQILQGFPTADSSATGDAQIAWRGWVNSYFVRKSTVGTANGPAAYNHTHGNITSTGAISGTGNANKVVVTDANGSISCGTATTGDLQAVCSAVTATSASGTYYASKLKANANSSTAGVEIDGPNKAVRLGTSTTQCTISESSGGLTLNGATSAKLKGGSTVTLDAPANGASLTNSPTDAESATSSLHIATCGWTASKFKSKDAEAEEQTVDVVTSVGWNGTSLFFKKRTLTIKDGEITGIGTESVDQPPIDTPVVIQWS